MYPYWTVTSGSHCEDHVERPNFPPSCLRGSLPSVLRVCQGWLREEDSCQQPAEMKITHVSVNGGLVETLDLYFHLAVMRQQCPLLLLKDCQRNS